MRMHERTWGGSSQRSRAVFSGKPMSQGFENNKFRGFRPGTTSIPTTPS